MLIFQGVLYLLNIDGWRLIHFLLEWSLFRGGHSFNFGGVNHGFRSEANNLSCFLFVFSCFFTHPFWVVGNEIFFETLKAQIN